MDTVVSFVLGMDWRGWACDSPPKTFYSHCNTIKRKQKEAQEQKGKPEYHEKVDYGRYWFYRFRRYA
jgi:hypothetical protein